MRKKKVYLGKNNPNRVDYNPYDRKTADRRHRQVEIQQILTELRSKVKKQVRGFKWVNPTAEFVYTVATTGCDIFSNATGFWVKELKPHDLRPR